MMNSSNDIISDLYAFSDLQSWLLRLAEAYTDMSVGRAGFKIMPLTRSPACVTGTSHFDKASGCCSVERRQNMAAVNLKLLKALVENMLRLADSKPYGFLEQDVDIDNIVSTTRMILDYTSHVRPRSELKWCLPPADHISLETFLSLTRSY